VFLSLVTITFQISISQFLLPSYLLNWCKKWYVCQFCYMRLLGISQIMIQMVWEICM